MDDKQRIETAKWVLERTLGWIATSDAKIGVAVAIDTTMIGGLSVALSASSYHLRTAWFYLFFLSSAAGMTMALLCAGMAAIPRMLGPVDSLVFFARIAEKSQSEYMFELSQVTEKKLLDDLTVQIHRNAEIATAKHQWVRKSMYWSFLSAIPWLIALGVLVKA